MNKLFQLFDNMLFKRINAEYAHAKKDNLNYLKTLDTRQQEWHASMLGFGYTKVLLHLEKRIYELEQGKQNE